jgi:hypothetical protein
LVHLATEIERQANAKRDYIAQTPRLRVVENGRDLAVGEQGVFPMTDHTLLQIGERTGVPAKYLRKMQDEAPQLLAENVNHWFSAKPERRMVRTLDGNARAFLSDRYQRIDNRDIAQAALPVLLNTPGLRIISSEITENRLYIKAASSQVVGEVKSRRVGDLVEAGVMIANSEVGLGAVQVTPFAYFLACTNGMTREGGKRWAHLGRIVGSSDETAAMLSDETKAAEDKALTLKVRDVLAAALDETIFQSWLARLQNATEQKLEGNPAKAVEVLGNKLSFTQDEEASILRHIIEGGDLSRYGVINAITRTGADAQSYDRATELEAAGSQLLELAASEWQEIRLAA